MGVWFFFKHTTKRLFIDGTKDTFSWFGKPSSIVMITAVLVMVSLFLKQYLAFYGFILILFVVYYWKEYESGAWKHEERKLEEELLRQK